MLDISLKSRNRFCDGMTRRDFVRIGALTPLGLALPSLLKAESKGRKSRAKSVVLVYLGGGMSHHDTFDPKPDAPAEIRGNYKPIGTSVPGVQISEKLPSLSRVMNKMTVIRSGGHNNDHHETATNWIMSGRFGSAFGDHPAIGAVVAHETGFTGTMPPYVAVPSNPGFTWELGKSAYLGGRFESFKAGDPNNPAWKVQDVSPAVELSPRKLERRETLLRAVDDLADRVHGNDQIATYDEFRQRATAMILSTEARKAFDIDSESVKLRDRYGRTTFGQSCLLARRLIQSNVRYVTVSYGGWDHHGKIFEGLDKKLPEFDRGLSAFVEDMDAHGLLDDTLVVVMGEFGRSPKVNKDAGRDHWGPAGSLLMFGAGVKKGFVLGSTDKHGGFVSRRPVSPADVAFTILDSMGIDPRKQLVTPDGRPMEILDQGELISELLA